MTTIQECETEREVRIRLPESVFLKLVDLDDESMCGKDALVSEMIEQAHDEMMGRRGKRDDALAGAAKLKETIDG